MSEYRNLILLVLLFIVLIGSTLYLKFNPYVVAEQIKENMTTIDGNCDLSLTKYVSNQQNLAVSKPCAELNGTIKYVDREDDGSLFILVDLDSNYKDMLNEVNVKDQHSYLVARSLCVNEPKDGNESICGNYRSTVSLPLVESHVHMEGSLVLDTANGWMELTPVRSIRAI